jgi:phosphoglycerol transferase MdoB-like AlkP superfamily enzyme
MLSRIRYYLSKVLIAIFAFYITNWFFFLFNYKTFSDIPFISFIKVTIVSLRFILSSVATLWLPFTLFIFFPFSFKESIQKKIADFLYLTPLGASIILNSIDWAYYQFTAKRTGAELFYTSGLKNDILRLMPRFTYDYWYIFLLVILLLIFFIWINKKANLYYPLLNTSSAPIVKWALFIIILGINIIAIRGGTQLRPIKPITAGIYTQPAYIPLVLNTPFCIIKSLDDKLLEKKNYFTNEDELKKYINPIKIFNGNGLTTNPNVVIIILESFSKEYMGYGGVFKGYTPFLDSLLNKSWFFPNALANGKRSIEGIPAILGGIPSISETPYISSNYSSNIIDALPKMLNSKGYNSAFFHGGHNGTMGFDYFAKLSGFDKYFGFNEYNGMLTDKDGNWGIYDEPFLNFFAEKLNSFKQPFFASLFTLSSHHPFKLPDNFTYNGPTPCAHPILKTIYYTDYALKKFFDSVQNKPWFKNTLFIITADHTGPDLTPSYGTMAGIYKIPIAFYMPQFIKPNYDNRIMQQIDIVPTVLQLIGFKGKSYCLGSNMADTTTKGFAINYLLNTYQYFTDSLLFHFYNEKPLRLLNYFNDTLLQKNLLTNYPERAKELELKTKAFIQTYHNDLINNATHAH